MELQLNISHYMYNYLLVTTDEELYLNCRKHICYNLLKTSGKEDTNRKSWLYFYLMDQKNILFYLTRVVMEVVFLLRVFLLLLRAVSWWREKSFEGNYLIRNLHNMNRTLNRCIVNTSYNIIQFVRMSRVIVLFFYMQSFVALNNLA